MDPGAIKSRDVLVHAGPGAGKTLGALLVFKEMRREGLLNKFIVFVHRNTIALQWEQASKSLGLNVEYLENLPLGVSPSKDLHGLILTYQSAAMRLKHYMKDKSIFEYPGLLAIADEAHHLGVSEDEPDGPVWGKTFIELTNRSRLRLGLTGTPFRADNLAFCSARKVRVRSHGEVLEQITPDLCVEPRDLISVGDVRPLEFHFQDGLVEHSYEGQPDKEVSSLSNESRESWRSRNLRRAIKLNDSSGIAMQLIMRSRKKLLAVCQSHNNAAGLVIARDISHATAISNILKEYGDSVLLVHSQDKYAKEYLGDFQSSEFNWLVSVDMCSEGFDAPRIRVIAYLSTVVTRSRFLQAITRAVRMSAARSSQEPIPRDCSYVYAPADPLLMDYARNWSLSKPYLIKAVEKDIELNGSSWISKGANLPLEAVGEKVGEMIKLRTAELPNFLNG